MKYDRAVAASHLPVGSAACPLLLARPLPGSPPAPGPVAHPAPSHRSVPRGCGTRDDISCSATRSLDRRPCACSNERLHASRLAARTLRFYQRRSTVRFYQRRSTVRFYQRISTVRFHQRRSTVRLYMISASPRPREYNELFRADRKHFPAFGYPGMDGSSIPDRCAE